MGNVGCDASPGLEVLVDVARVVVDVVAVVVVVRAGAGVVRAQLLQLLLLLDLLLQLQQQQQHFTTHSPATLIDCCTFPRIVQIAEFYNFDKDSVEKQSERSLKLLFYQQLVSRESNYNCFPN